MVNSFSTMKCSSCRKCLKREVTAEAIVVELNTNGGAETLPVRFSLEQA